MVTKDSLMYWSIPRNSPSILKCHEHTFTLVKEIFDLFNDGNTMGFFDAWLPNPELRIKEAVDWVNTNPDNKAVFIIGFDPAGWSEDIPHHSRIFVLNYPKFSLFNLVTNRYFKKYTLEDVKPKSFDNLFLCYQNKLSYQRVALYYELKDLPGIVTITGKDFHRLNLGVENVPDGFHNNGFGGVYVSPNDILSLGNLDIWNSSFLNIVSETVGEMHITEKTFKPFIGMRPYITFSKDTSLYYDTLSSLGFENFNDELGFDANTNHNFFDNVRNIRETVENLKGENLSKLYSKLYPKLLHNYYNVSKSAKKIETHLKTDPSIFLNKKPII